MKYLLFAFLFVCCGEPGKHRNFNTDMSRDSTNLAESIKHVDWVTKMKIALIQRGIDGVNADLYIDSLEKNIFKGSYPEWHEKHAK